MRIARTHIAQPSKAYDVGQQRRIGTVHSRAIEFAQRLFVVVQTARTTRCMQQNGKGCVVWEIGGRKRVFVCGTKRVNTIKFFQNYTKPAACNNLPHSSHVLASSGTLAKVAKKPI